eukprot:3989883-Pyramimonas_sp.AAC.1
MPAANQLDPSQAAGKGLFRIYVAAMTSLTEHCAHVGVFPQSPMGSEVIAIGITALAAHESCHRPMGKEGCESCIAGLSMTCCCVPFQVYCGDGGYHVADDGRHMVGDLWRLNYHASEAEIAVAIQRIQTQFVTFGLMEEYVESVARLHEIWQGIPMMMFLFHVSALGCETLTHVPDKLSS